MKPFSLISIRDKVGTKVASKILKVKHRQLVFTIPFEIRKYFRKYHQLLSLLFKAVNKTLTDTLKEKGPNVYKKKNENYVLYVFFIHMVEI